MNHISHKILYIYDSAWDEVRLWDTPKLIKPDDEHWNLYPTEKEVDMKNKIYHSIWRK